LKPPRYRGWAIDPYYGRVPILKVGRARRGERAYLLLVRGGTPHGRRVKWRDRSELAGVKLNKVVRRLRE
jgi:hypothetical protein